MPSSNPAQSREKMGALGVAVWLLGIGASVYFWILAGSALFRWLDRLTA